MSQPSHLHAIHLLLKNYLENQLNIDLSKFLRFSDLNLGTYQGNIIFHSFDPVYSIDAVAIDFDIYFDIALMAKFESSQSYLSVWQTLHDTSQTLYTNLKILKKEGLTGTVNGIEIVNALKEHKSLAPYKMGVDLSEDCYQVSCLGKFYTKYRATDFQNLPELF